MAPTAKNDGPPGPPPTADVGSIPEAVSKGFQDKIPGSNNAGKPKPAEGAYVPDAKPNVQKDDGIILGFPSAGEEVTKAGPNDGN